MCSLAEPSRLTWIVPFITTYLEAKQQPNQQQQTVTEQPPPPRPHQRRPSTLSDAPIAAKGPFVFRTGGAAVCSAAPVRTGTQIHVPHTVAEAAQQ